MNNAYMIDVLLIVMAAAFMIMAIRAIKVKMNIINDNDVGVQMLTFILSNTFKSAMLVAAPSIAAYGFVMWRSAELMYRFKMWGSGGIGLTVILSIIGVIVISLFSCLLMVKNNKYLSLKAPKNNGATNDSRR